jgi:tRNA/tmRNA/rRNA uracil-C5-methylase (TrmA/RlmC/RlmD family)
VSKRDAIEQLLGKRKSQEIQETVNTGIQKSVKKKATFDFDDQFHTELKIFAAKQNKKMVDVVVEAAKEYMRRHKNTSPVE